MPTRPLARILHITDLVIPVTLANLTKRKPPLWAAGIYSVFIYSAENNDPAILKSDSSSLTLDKTQKRNRQSDKWIHLSNLLNLVGTGVSNLGSRATTGAGLVITKQVGTNADQGRLSFRLTGQKVTSAVKGCRCNLRTRSIMQTGDSRDAFCQSEEGNLLSGHANLANGSVLGVHI